MVEQEPVDAVRAHPSAQRFRRLEDHDLTAGLGERTGAGEPGEPGSETWERCPANATSFCDPEAWKHGGGSIWLTGSYDPQLNLTYWGVGNVGPDYNAAQRPGDNLYTDSVVALDGGCRPPAVTNAPAS